MSYAQKAKLQGLETATSLWTDIKSCDGKIRVTAQTYTHAVAEGDIPNH